MHSLITLYVIYFAFCISVNTEWEKNNVSFCDIIPLLSYYYILWIKVIKIHIYTEKLRTIATFVWNNYPKINK